MDAAIVISPATRNDAAAITFVLRACRDEPSLFQKSPAAVARSIEDFFVARDDKGEIIGCAGLHRDSSELAEIYALAAMPGHQGQGVGRPLVDACIQNAMDNGVAALWLGTMKAEYFSRYGFRPISRSELPRSVLRRKLPMVFEQPVGRWLSALFGRHTFMRRPIDNAALTSDIGVGAYLHRQRSPAS